MRWSSLLFAFAVAVMGTAQETPRPPAVRIDAVVIDRAGRPLADLGPSDLELRCGGVAQPIDSVELRTAGAPDGGRVFALFLDEFHVSPGATSEHVRRTLLRFLNEHIRPADRLAVMKPLDSQLAIELTGDRTVWERAIESFEGRAGDFAPRTAFEEQYLGRAPAVVEASRAQIVTSALRALVTRIGEASGGRAAVAFVTEGFAEGGPEDRARRLPDFQSIVRVASRVSVAIYPLYPAAVPADGTDGAAITVRLKALAADTGGEMGAGDDLASALAHMARDLDSYYVVTFRPSQGEDGRYRRLELTSKRANAIVRAHAGYWMPSPPVAAAAADTPRPMRVLRRSAAIDSWYGLTRLADGRMRLRVTWEPSRRKSVAPRAPDAVVVRAARSGGDPLYEARVRAAQLAEVIVPIGRIELDLTVLAADGREIDREARDIDVPHADDRRVTALAPEIIRARTRREFLASSADPAAAPTPAREFSRSEHLIVRAPMLSSPANPLTVSARLLNRWGQLMRELASLEGPGSGIVQFDLPLGWLVPGEYEIELRTVQGSGETSQKIPLKVIG